MVAPPVSTGDANNITAQFPRLHLRSATGTNNATLLWDTRIRKDICNAGLFKVAYGPIHTLESIREANPSLSIDKVREQYQEYLTNTRPENTRLFRLLYDRVDLSGEWETIDITHIDRTFVSKTEDLADGRGFFEWILSRVDDSAPAIQKKIKASVDSAAVRQGASIKELVYTATQLHSNWLRLSGPHDATDFAERLLNAIPTKPEASLLTTLRSHFAGLVTTGSSIIQDSHGLIEHLAAHARTLGIEEGSAKAGDHIYAVGMYVSCGRTREETMVSRSEDAQRRFVWGLLRVGRRK